MRPRADAPQLKDHSHCSRQSKSSRKVCSHPYLLRSPTPSQYYLADLRAIEAALQASDGFSPSAGARTDSNMSKVTETGFYVYGRPLLNYGLSVAIYNKTLGKLVQELGSLHVPSRERNAILADCLDLMDIACDFHPSEAIRQGRLEKTVESLLPGDVKWSVSSSRPTAGARWTVGVNEALLPYCLLELKNGHVGGDGRFQNMLTYKAYIKMVSSNKSSSACSSSCS